MTKDPFDFSDSENDDDDDEFMFDNALMNLSCIHATKIWTIKTHGLESSKKKPIRLSLSLSANSSPGDFVRNYPYGTLGRKPDSDQENTSIHENSSNNINKLSSSTAPSFHQDFKPTPPPKLSVNSGDVQYHDIFGSSSSSDEVIPSMKDNSNINLPPCSYHHLKTTPQFDSVAVPNDGFEYNKTPPPFHIVLVNIKKAAEHHHICCEKMPLSDNNTTAYVALSYRWGELDEQMVRATDEYHAKVVSFQLQDFFKLCQAMCHEPELKEINYVWVDAICVDQENMEKRKATIYRMNDIYRHAAVPDLHAFHLFTSSTTANRDAMQMIQKYRCYLYYLLMATPEAHIKLVDMDHAWMDSLGIPNLDLSRKHLISSAQQNNLLIQNLMSLFTHQSMNTIQENNHDPPQQLSYRIMLECQHVEWQQQLNHRQTEIIQSMRFLQSLMEDWSNRAWVISEYHIAKKKTGKLKFWFNQLSCPELDGCAFFQFEFNIKRSILTPIMQSKQIHLNQLQQQHPYTFQTMDRTVDAFKDSMRRRLTRRSVLEMMLQTKASKNDDRFHAIIPHAAKYKHHIKDRHSISDLGISGMLSVRLQLMEWMNLKDKLILLYSECQPLPSTIPSLPTFATLLKDLKPGLSVLLTKYPQYCNFDLNGQGYVGDDICLLNRRIIFSTSTSSGKYNSSEDELWLCPRTYYTPAGGENLIYYDMDPEFRKCLGLDMDDSLDVILIPLFILKEDKEMDPSTTITKRLLTSVIRLIGSWKKNIWLRTPVDNQNTVLGHMYLTQYSRLPFGFRVF